MPPNLRLSIALAVLLASTHTLAAQDSTAAVIVRLRHATAPVSGAIVRANGQSGVSDVHGDARLRLLIGARTIQITRLGFADTTVTTSVQPGTANIIAFELREIALETEAVVVSATRSGTIVSEQAIRVEAVPLEEIEENLTVAPGNVTMLLQELPGVRIAPAVPGLGGATLQMRGMPGRLTQVLVDGLPLFGVEPDAFSLLQTPPLDLARVEVVKGVASALYGGSAIGGVLNLVSSRPEGDPSMLLNASSRKQYDIVGFVPHRFSAHWGATMTLSANQQTRQDLDGDAWSEIPGYRRVVIRPRVFWSAGSAQSLLMTAGFTDETRHGGMLPGRRLPDGTPYPEDLHTRRADAGAIGHVLMPNGLLIGTRIAATNRQHDRTFGAQSQSDRQNTFLAEATLGGSHAGHTWLLGSAFDYDAFHAPTNPGGEYSYQTPAVFAQDEYSPAAWLSATASARADFNNTYGTFSSPRISALFRVSPAFNVRASGGTGWAAPRTQAVASARAERARSASLDADWKSGRAEISMSVFASRVADSLNVRSVRGAESLVHYTAGVLHLIASYTYLNSQEELVPKHAAEIGAIAEDEKRGRVGLELGYTGKMRVENDPYRAISRPYSEVNILAAKYWGETQLFVNATNILDVRQSNYDPLLRPSRSATGQPATDIWAPLTGRVINIGVRLEL